MATCALMITRFTAFFDLTDLPAISLSCDRDAHGMLIDMQRVSDHRQEAKRLRAAYTWKQTTACLALSDEERWKPNGGRSIFSM